MLQTIREHTQGWIAAVIISIIILTFALWGIHSYFVGGGNNAAVATVNGVDISREQLSSAFERLRRQLQSQNNSAAEINRNTSAIKQTALQNLIEIEVLKQASLDQGFSVSDQQVDAYLQNMPEFQVNGQFSVNRFNELLSSSMLSTNDFIDLIRTSMLVDQPKLGTIFSSFALPDEINSLISIVNQEREIAYLTLTKDNLPPTPINIPAEEIKKYYEANRKEFTQPEKISVDYVALTISDVGKTINPTDATLKSFYQENINSFTQPMTWNLISFEIPTVDITAPQLATLEKKAKEAVKSIRAGTDINQVASTFSVKTTTQNGVTLKQLPSELQKAVSELKEAGQVSNVIKTKTGLVIVKNISMNMPQVLSYDTVKDKVREQYVRQHAEEKFADVREQLADLTYEHPNSLTEAAKVLNLPIQTSSVFTRTASGTDDISKNDNVRQAAFSQDVLNMQNNSDVIQLSPNSVVVIRIKSHVPAKMLPLAEVAKQIETHLTDQAVQNKLTEYVEKLTKQLQAGADPTKIAADAKVQWQTSAYIGRYENGIDSAILDLSFRLPNPANQKQKFVYGFTKLENGYAIVSLKGVKAGKADAKQTEVFNEQAQNSEGLIEYELYKQSQVKQAKIKIYNQTS